MVRLLYLSLNHILQLSVFVVCNHADRGDYSNLMPSYFAEVLLRIYTKNRNIFGLVQAGYRRVLKHLQDGIERGTIQPPEQTECNATCSCSCHVNPPVPTAQIPKLELTAPDELPPGAPTPPVTEAPSTPKASAHSRQGSFSFPTMGGSAGPGSASTPHLNFNTNVFTTVPPTYVPPGSPSTAAAKNRKPRSKGVQGRHMSGSSNSSMESIDSAGGDSSTTLATERSPSVASVRNKKREREVDGAGEDTPGTEREVKKHRMKG